jgi:hypothetical protein
VAEETIHERIDRERKAANPRASKLRDFRNYARGVQRGTLTKAQYDILKGVTGRDFCDNICKMVLEASSSRLQLVRFEVAVATVLEWLHDFWVLVSMAEFSGQVHFATLRDGNHAVSLAWDNEAKRVRLARELWWDGKSGIFVAYGDLGRPTYAVKEWKNEAGLPRRVVYWPDRIERYVKDGEGWQPYKDPDGTPWTDRWLDRAGAPLGIPVVHFKNSHIPADSSDGDADSAYGLSDLDGGVLGLQDEINDIQRDITAAARYTGYQMLYATGYTPGEDADGNVIPPRVEPGAFFYNKQAGSFGTLPAGDLGQLEKAHTMKLQAVSRMTATPLHMIGGDWPSGEAILRAEQPLVEKATTLGTTFGPAWGSVAHKATLLYNAFAAGGLDVEAMIISVFAPPDRRDPLTLSAIARAQARFVSRRQVLRILGYSPDQIEAIIQELDADAPIQPPVEPPGDEEDPEAAA